MTLNPLPRDNDRREQAKQVAREIMRQEFNISPLMADTPIGRTVFESIDKAVDAAIDRYVAFGQQRAGSEG